MKRILLFMLSCFVVSAQTLFAEEAEETYWTYTEEGEGYGCISNAVWKFYAKRNSKNSSDLYVDAGSKGEFKGEATKVYPVNLTYIYNNEKSQRFFVTSLNCFSLQNADNCPYKDRLSEFIAPDCTSFISGHTFRQCTSLTNVVLNENFNVLPNSAFLGCSALVNFSPRSFKVCNRIYGYVFYGCKKLAGKFVFDACTTVAENVFTGCEALEEVSMPVAENISSQMFTGCLSLEKVYMPSALSIGQSAFEGCEKLSALTVSPNLEEIKKSRAFKNCTSLPPDFVNLIAGKGLKSFGDAEVFSGCTSLTSLIWNFPNLEKNVVNSSCFSGCSSLGKVVFKTPVDEIQANAFINIREGAEIYLPKEVPGVVGQWAIGIKKANKDNPVAWPKAFVPDETKDQWLEAMGQTCRYFKKEQFNESKAEAYGTNHKDYPYISLAHALEIMKLDTDMCTYDSESNRLTIKDKRVIGFVFAQKNDKAACYGCWVLRAPESGFQVIVR